MGKMKESFMEQREFESQNLDAEYEYQQHLLNLEQESKLENEKEHTSHLLEFFADITNQNK